MSAYTRFVNSKELRHSLLRTPKRFLLDDHLYLAIGLGHSVKKNCISLLIADFFSFIYVKSETIQLFQNPISDFSAYRTLGVFFKNSPNLSTINTRALEVTAIQKFIENHKQQLTDLQRK